MGNGTSRMVNRRSGGESRWMGKMVDKVVIKDVRIGVNSARRATKASLVALHESK